MTPSSYRIEGVRTGRTTGVRTALAVTALAVAIGACADRPPDSAPDSPADVPELALVPLARFDGESIPGQAPFGRIADIEIGGNGSVFVLDALSSTVRVFDSRGTEVRSFGGRGAGPGELEGPSALLWGPDGNLWVADLGNGRFTVFGPDGGLVATYRAPPLFLPMAFGFSEAGLFYTVDLEGGSLENWSFLLGEHEVGEAEVGPLRQVDLPFVERPLVYTGPGMLLGVPLAGLTVFRFDPSGRLWYADTGEPWVHRSSISGAIDLTLGRELDPLPVTPAELQQALDDLSVEDRRRMGPAGVAELASLIPENTPPLQGFFFDDEQHVWVIRTTQDDGNEGQYAMDIYDLGGTLLAVAHAALDFDPMPRVRDGLLAGVVRDDLGVESVVLYRIQR